MNDSERLAQIERIIGYVFQNKVIGLESLNADHHMVLRNGQLLGLRQNKDTAIVGEKAIDLVLSTLWYRSRNSQGLVIYLIYSTLF
jgi:hypothetical protein